MKHISSLDGLRGTAVLMVVFFHYFPRQGLGLLSAPAGLGWIGVDLFFVLSGFLITNILYEQRGTDHYFRNFYMRRLLRLAPLYYFLFALVLVLTPFLQIHWKPMQFGSLLYGSNFVFSQNIDLAKLGPFQFFHTWSLSVEEQFYLIWPWLVGGRWSRETLRKICIAGIVAAPLLRLVLLQTTLPPIWIYTSLPMRMDSLLMGALLALSPRPSLRAVRVAACVAVVLVGIAVGVGHSTVFQSRPMEGFGYSALAILAASLLTMSLDPTTMAHRVFSWKVLRFYGKYSYGLYLWHYFFREQYELMKVWMGRHMGSPRLAELVCFAAMLLFSTAIAVASFHWLELPFLRLKDRFSSSKSASVRERQEARGRVAVESELQTAPGLD